MNSIDIFPWNDNFNTGVPEIDEQHRQLVQLLNTLASHVAFNSDIPELNVIFDKLADYAAYHFQTEEAIWHRYFQNDVIETTHKDVHNQFIQTVLKLREEGNSKAVDEVISDILGFLARWLASHILETDRYLAMVVLAIQAGLSLENAKQRANEQLSGSHRVLIDIILSIYESLSANTLQLMRELAERRRHEESLRKLSLAVEQSPSEIIITDLDANIEFVNEAFVKATGYSPDEVIGQNPKLLQSGKTSKETYQQLWATITRGDVWQGELINKRKDGSEYIEMARIAPVYQEDGDITHYLSIKEDITVRKQLERELANQLVFTQAVINAEIDGISVCHAIDSAPYVRFTVWNRSMEKLTGFSLEEINRLGWYQTVYVDPDTQQRALQRMERMRQGDDIQGEEWNITRKDGDIRCVQIFTTVCANDADGAHVLAVMHDITERKKIEAKLIASESHLRTIIDTEPECIKIVSAEGQLLQMNPAGLAIVEADSLEQVLGKQVIELIAPEFRPAFAEMHQRVISGETMTLEFEVQGIKGRRRWLDTHAVPMTLANGEVVQLAVTRDITQRKESERALREAKDAAEQANITKSQFLANMSHEIRTPMNAIIGLSQLLFTSSLDDKQRDYLEKIIGASEHLLGILNEILDFSKIEANQLALSYEVFDLNELIHNLDGLFATPAREKGLEFDLKVASNVNRYLVGDILRLQQLLANLLSNSIKFTEHGFVRMIVNVVSIEQQRINLKFSIEDSGIGVSDEQKSWLFKPFVQADSSITRRFGGTGLGLAISRKLAQMMGGDIHLTSALGEGSIFSFEIQLGMANPPPLAESGITPRIVLDASKLQQAAVGLVNVRVLLVEDNPLNLQVAKTFLRNAGLNVVTANDGWQALDILAEHEFDIVLMDIQLPGLDGLEVTRQLRSQACFADLPILAMSAGITQDEQAKCQLAGMTDFIPKPIDPLSMIEKLAKALTDRSSTPAAESILAGTDSETHSQHQLHDKLAKLQTLLSDDKLVPAELLNGLSTSLSAAQTESFNRLSKAIASYDYQKALQIIKDMQ
jgi:hemerythrin-like metal-binding protein/PAS domain S-box-containing protein